MQDPAKATYSKGRRDSLTGLDFLMELHKEPLPNLIKTAEYGDIVSYHIMGQPIIQVNHPDLIRQVLIDNHKNYRKTQLYIRFEPIIGKGLFTSDGEKWKQDRQKIQPMFHREQLEDYYFTVISEVAEKYKQRWLVLIDSGRDRINLSEEMVAMTVEIIVKIACGKDNLDDATVRAIHEGYDVFTEYLKTMRMFPKVDMRKLLRTPAYRKFHNEYIRLGKIFQNLLDQHKRGELSDELNLLALLLKAQQAAPEHFTDQDVMDHIFSMIFGGFETTSALMQWMYYVLDERPDIEKKMREEIITNAPCVLQADSSGLTHEAVGKLDYVEAMVRETMRLYPPIWVSSREPIEDDYFGDFKVKRGTVVILPHYTMHRHPRWWDKPNAFIPERFLGDTKIDDGLYFPFSHGPRKCIGFKLAEMEAKIIIAKLLPFFDMTVLNPPGNGMYPSITLKLLQPLQVKMRRANL
jgi:cytochrome P450